MLKGLPEDLNGTSTSLAAEHLFWNRNNAVKLTNEEAKMLHRVTAQLLFACKQGRPDIQTAISFLCTSVKPPDQVDYKKLAREIKYIHRTTFMCLTMEAKHLD